MDALPQADAILCRDGLVHLSHRDARAAVSNFRRSNAEWLISTTFTGRASNEDIHTGGWRPLNLALHPFDLGDPVEVLTENCTEEGGRWLDKALGVWRLR